MENTKRFNENASAGRTALHILLRVIIYVLLIIGAFILLFPYLWMLLTSFKDDYEAISLELVLFPKHWIFSNYKEIWTVVPLIRGVWNTLLVEISVIVVGTFVSSMAAFSFAKLKLPHKNFWLLFLMSGMMVPYAALMMPQFRAFMALNMFDTLWPLILPGLFGNISMMFFLIQYMRGVSNAFFEAAKIDGAGYMRMFISVMLPMVKTALAAQIIFWFIGIWNDDDLAADDGAHQLGQRGRHESSPDYGGRGAVEYSHVRYLHHLPEIFYRVLGDFGRKRLNGKNR